MKLKTIIITILFVLCSVLLTGCQSPKISDNTSLYKSPNVEVTIADDADPIKYSHYEWATFTEDMAYTKNTVIITGVATNVRQANVNYEYMDIDVSDGITIFDVDVSEVLACRSGSFQEGDIVTIGVGYNMDKYGEGLPIITEGASYLIFCYVAEDQENDVLELAEYVDCGISAPKDLFLERVGDFYLSIDFFSDVSEAHNLAEYLDLTEKQIASLSTIAVADTDAVDAYIDEEIMLDPDRIDMTEFADALYVLKTRTMDNSTELWNLANRSYLISCDKLEEYVRDTALAYGG